MIIRESADWKYALDVSEVLRHLNLSADFGEELEPFVKRTLREAKPRALAGEVEVTDREKGRVCIAGDWQESRILAGNLADARKVVPYVVTCGVELQGLSDACADPLERFWQDTLNEMILHQAGAQLEDKVMEVYGADFRFAMNPGSVPDWPIDGLRAVFGWLPDVTERTGVYLTDSCLMRPVKSVSGIYFHSEREYANCQLCPRHCRNRRMEFDPVLAASFYED